MQGRLLRVLQEKQVMRLGDTKLIPVDARVICASNRDLRALVDANEFRDDLYFRIAILSLFVPPLRERVEDIELLSIHFMKKLAEFYGKSGLKLSEGARNYLRHYDFRGNVRELRGMIERAVVVCEGKTIGIEDLAGMPHTVSSMDPGVNALQFPDGMRLLEIENEYIRQVLRKTGGSVKASSAISGS